MPTLPTDEAVKGVGTAFASPAPSGLTPAQTSAYEGVQKAFAPPAPATTPDRTPPATRVDPSTVGAPETTATPTVSSLAEYKASVSASPEEIATIADRAAKEADRQTQIINAEFDKRRTSQQDLNNRNMARVKALNVNTGNKGSSFGASADATEDKRGSDALDTIEGQRSAALAGVLAKADALKENDTKALEAQKRGDLTSYNAIREKNNSDITNTLSEFATNGVTAQKLKTADPEFYKTLGNNGWSDLRIDSYINEKLPSSQKISYKEQLTQDKDGNAVLLRYGIDPATNQLDEKSYPLGMAYSSLATKTTGTDFKTVTDGSGQVYLAPNNIDFTKQGDAFKQQFTPLGGPKATKAPSGSPASVIKSGGLTLSKDDITAGAKLLETHRRGDYYDQNLYVSMAEKWVTEGGKIADFVKQYPTKNLDPKLNYLLPASLKTTAKTPAATSSNLPAKK